MADPQHSEVQIPIPIPFGSILKAIDQLPTEALLQLLHLTEVALATRAGTQPEFQVEDEIFWESELGRYIACEADIGSSRVIAIADDQSNVLFISRLSLHRNPLGASPEGAGETTAAPGFSTVSQTLLC